VRNLNDPTEGIYRNSRFDAQNISETFDGKNSYSICSFSQGDTLYNLLLWIIIPRVTKGIAIEINDINISNHCRAAIELKNGSKIRN
jgi:hypothetical protein